VLSNLFPSRNLNSNYKKEVNMIEVLRKSISLMLVLAFGTLQFGCSAFTGSRQNFSVTTAERDAQIYINGVFAGTGTAKVTVPRDQTVSVLVKKDGCYPATREVGTKMSSTGIADIIGGCIILIPFIGLLFPGSQQLDQDNVAIVLEKAGK
jgi:hypothetical protein